MNIQKLTSLYSTSAKTKAVVKILADKAIESVWLGGLAASSLSVFFASIYESVGKTMLFILQDADEAGYFYGDMIKILGEDMVLMLPSSYRRKMKFAQRDAANEILRTECLARLSSGDNFYIVTYPEALSELVVSQKRLVERTLKLSLSQNIKLGDISIKLRELGFREVDYVYEPGSFAIRGSILDVYSYSSELPYRVDFFGDEIDTIRTFEIESQLSKERKDMVEIVPELSSLEDERVSFFSLLPDDALLVLKDLDYIEQIIERTYREGFSLQAISDKITGETEVKAGELLREMGKELNILNPQVFISDIQRHRKLYVGTNTIGDVGASVSFDIVSQPLFHKNFELLISTFSDYRLKGYEIKILSDSEKQVERIRDIVKAQFTSNNDEEHGIILDEVKGTIHEGFIDNDLKLCLFTDHQIFDRFHKYSLRSDVARRGKVALTMKELQEMEIGDFMVHVDFGIGKFGGLVRTPVGDSYHEVIRIIYQNNDKVDVSIHSLYKISKYRKANTEEQPRLSTLGTGAWERLKEKAKKRIKDIARDLIKLYAKRRSEKGFAFSEDTYLQHELEASFLYEDTPDQLKATTEVKGDMEASRPMDRLICGDVGFGKTEVAIRAAFKAACDSKQVAVLVPTTVLAFQHYKTFTKRLEGLPVRVEYISRAKTAKQTKEILLALEEGRIDILIGTHKLIAKSVKWKDLGLLIIDEEQKFGVSTKEKLRQIKTNVDTLTMSATPIPRTLQFSLMGARDMSIMRTPPPNRHPIHTEIGTYNGELIAEAIGFEMSRGGQVYFVNDRISNLPEIEKLIHKYVPDCRVAIGHGQMKPEDLEEILMGFMNYDYDLLLSTSIIENGIDIPNANTIIINSAHRVGLSDLHQMRGRVGRSNKKAFCYLLAPPKSVLTQEARRRLEALELFSDLGSGFNLAMQDLDIRGAGNLLGAEQSGFMEDLGYETYQKILTQAVAELKNDEFTELYAEDEDSLANISGEGFVDDCAIDSDFEMYFPDSYVPGSSERMLLYRELDSIEDDATLEAYKQRLTDRFGTIPKEGEELMQVVVLRRLGKRLGCEKIILKSGRMTLQFVSNAESVYYRSNAFGAIINFISSNPKICDLKEVKGRRMLHIKGVNRVQEGVDILKGVLS